MVTDRQVRILMKLINKEGTLAAAAAKAASFKLSASCCRRIFQPIA
jgi:hypothetical protein